MDLRLYSFLLWYSEKRDINFLSTSSSPEQPSQTVKRKVCSQMIEVEKPYVADLYTLKMAGVGQADQLWYYHYTGRRTNRWYQYVFWFLVNVCMCNVHTLDALIEEEMLENNCNFAWHLGNNWSTTSVSKSALHPAQQLDLLCSVFQQSSKAEKGIMSNAKMLEGGRQKVIQWRPKTSACNQGLTIMTG